MRANIYNRLKAGDAKRATTMAAEGRSIEDIAGELGLNASAVESFLMNSADSADRKAQAKDTGGGSKEPDKAPEVNSSKAAIKLAEETGLDLDTVQGSGKDGAITVNDVRAAAE